jgi:hypothetical protein
MDNLTSLEEDPSAVVQRRQVLLAGHHVDSTSGVVWYPNIFGT